MISIPYPIILFIANVYKKILYFLFDIFSEQTKTFVESALLKKGIQINGPNPWDIQLHNDKFYSRVSVEGTLGFGESYMEGWWDCDDLIELHVRLNGKGSWFSRSYGKRIMQWLLYQSTNLQTKAHSFEVVDKHYNAGNEIYENMLDESMNYTCALWRNAKTLNEAQNNKMELLAQKLKLTPGMRVLDLGCGFGGLSKYLAEKHGVSVVGVNISKEQIKFARNNCKGLPVEFRLQDYRDVTEKFDRIVSVGLMEHIGFFNYSGFFELASRCLQDDGLFVLHTIGIGHKNVPLTDPWLDKYIFPKGLIPYYRHITDYSEPYFVLEDFDNMGYHYYKTLVAWNDNFKETWHKLAPSRGNDFYRMWTFYLQNCAGLFKCRKVQLYQVVFSKNGFPGGYDSVR